MLGIKYLYRVRYAYINNDGVHKVKDYSLIFDATIRNHINNLEELIASQHKDVNKKGVSILNITQMKKWRNI